MKSEIRDEERFYNLNFQRQSNAGGKIIYECHIVFTAQCIETISR